MADITGKTRRELNGTKARPAKKIPVWRIAWLGMTLSALLWFTPGAYFEKMQQFHEVELQTGSISQSEYDQTMTSNARYTVACKLCAAVLMLGSLIYLLSQLETRRRPAHTNTQ